MTKKKKVVKATKTKATKTQKVDVVKDLEKNVVTNAQAIAVAVEEGKVQRWEEPYPCTGLVKVVLNEACGISEITGSVGRMVQHAKGSVVIISAEMAQSLHRVISAAPEEG